MAAVTICSYFGPWENKACHCFHCFPFYLLWSDETSCLDLSFLMLNFKPAFSFSSSLSLRGSLVPLCLLPEGWCHLHNYFSLQSWFQLVLHPVQDFSWYTACKLNKQGDNIQPWHTPFPGVHLEDSKSKRWSKFTEFTFLFKSSSSICSYISQKKAYIMLSSFTDI